MVVAKAAATEAGRVCVGAACTIVRCKRHTAYLEAAGGDPVQVLPRASALAGSASARAFDILSSAVRFRR